ncbi:MAG: hypothetical protein M0026_19365 [Nocardiopsaceae bacterium]|nr:hypothetical protein [Nocardiopsaceae bacterium]
MSELPLEDVPGHLADVVGQREVVYITDADGHRLAAIVPPDVAVAGSAAVEALEDAADLAAAEASLAEPGENIGAADLWRELGV